jgi:hypothetical protein
MQPAPPLARWMKAFGMLLVLVNHLAFLPTMGFERHLLLAHCMRPERFRSEGYHRHAGRMTGGLVLLFLAVNGASVAMLRVPLLTGLTPLVWVVLMWCRPWAVANPQAAAWAGAALSTAGMVPYALRPSNVFEEHLLNGVNDLAVGLLIPWAWHALQGRRIVGSVTLACAVLPVPLILGDLLVMRFCQLDSILVWFAFLGFVASPPRWLLNPPDWLGWLGHHSLALYGLSFVPFLLKWYPTGFPTF